MMIIDLRQFIKFFRGYRGNVEEGSCFSESPPAI